MTLYKRDFTADIFLGIFNFFWTSCFTKQLLTTDFKGFYLLRMSNDYCFRRAAERQLSQCNRRNADLRAVLKSHKVLKGTKVFAVGCSVRNLKSFSEVAPHRFSKSC